MNRALISIVAPAYNEEENVAPFFEAVKGVMDGALPSYEWELLFVDDGSLDGTLARIRDIAARDRHVRALSFSRNFGHQAALTAGMQNASGQAVITMDCDLQDPPEVIPEMVRKWEAGNRIVYARRTTRHDRPFKRYTAELYYRLLSRFSDFSIPRDVGDFRLVDREALKNFLRLDEHARYLRGMVAWLGFKHDFVDFERPERIHGTTHYSLGRMTRLAMDGILNFTFLPLRIGMWVGLTAMLISVIFLIYMVVDILLTGTEYPLFKWLTVVLFGFMGLQFMFLWILGEYVGRIYDDVRKRPIYVINERISFGDSRE